jgi:hypothetical protein
MLWGTTLQVRVLEEKRTILEKAAAFLAEEAR